MSNGRHYPQKGDRKFVAHWYTEIGASPEGNVEEEFCKRGSLELPDLETALKVANGHDLNGEGFVSEEVFDVVWGEIERYTYEGERTFQQ